MKKIFEKIKEFIYDNKHFFFAGGLFVVMLVAVGASNAGAGEVRMTDIELTGSEGEEDFEIDANEDINRLITRYFEAYCSSDTDTLSQFVRPLTLTEKSYIEVYSRFVEDFDNIVCYTKSGLREGDTMVSVYVERHFTGSDTLAPGLDFFYVETDDKDELFINNVYSQFNQSNHEENTDPEIEALISGFENSDDMKALKDEVQSRFERAMESDGNLREVIEVTVPEAIASWANEIAKIAREQKENNETEVAENTEVSENTDESANTEVSDDEGSENAGDGDTEALDKNDGTEVSEENGSNTTVMYTITEINLRKKPTTNAEILKVIPKGKKVKAYLDTLDDDGWVKVIYSKKTGYVKREYLVRKKTSIPSDGDSNNDNSDTASTVTSTTDTAANPAMGYINGVPFFPEGTVITLTNGVNLRKGTSENTEKIATVGEGETIKIIISYAEGWSKVEWNGKTGYMKTELIR